MTSLRPYQEECLQAIKWNRDAGIYRQLVVSATGTGKTAILSTFPGFWEFGECLFSHTGTNSSTRQPKS